MNNDIIDKASAKIIDYLIAKNIIDLDTTNERQLMNIFDAIVAIIKQERDMS